MVVRGSNRSGMNHFVNLEDYESIMGKRYRILVCKYLFKNLEIDIFLWHVHIFNIIFLHIIYWKIHNFWNILKEKKKKLKGSLYEGPLEKGWNFQSLWLTKIKKSLEVGFIWRKISLKAVRRKDEVECTFFLHGMNKVKLLYSL